MNHSETHAAPDAPAFAAMIDLASARLGGVALAANDEFFAEKENLLNPGRGIFIPEKFTERGKWMDGWETRRRREPGHDWCIIQLGMRGRISGFDVDTNHFLGNFPESCSIDVLDAPPGTTIDELASADAVWQEAVAVTPLQGGSQHFLASAMTEPVTHVRLNIFPDGGVARLRVYGTVESILPADTLLDLAAIENGGTVRGCSCMFFGPKDNLIMPGEPANMGEGWETKRRRGPGNDWIVVQLGAPAQLESLQIDTTHFKGNAPDTIAVEWCALSPAAAAAQDFPENSDGDCGVEWKPLVSQSKVQPHASHSFTDLEPHAAATHLRLRIFPDGGIARLRAFGRVADAQPSGESSSAP